MSPPRRTSDRRSDMIDLLDYLAFVKRKTLIVGYLSLVMSSVGFCFMTAGAAMELEETDTDVLVVDDDDSLWPKWSRTGLSARRTTTTQERLPRQRKKWTSDVNRSIVRIHYQEWGVLATPWLLHSALWLPAQGAALVAAAPPQHSTAFALAALFCFASGLGESEISNEWDNFRERRKHRDVRSTSAPKAAGGVSAATPAANAAAALVAEAQAQSAS
ncbi:Protein of unknown function, partial [Gryllus bimaculatus]